MALNVTQFGTGALNIDACRIGFASAADEAESKGKNRHADFGSGPRENAVYGADERTRAEQGNYDASGRWPANVVLSHTEDCVLVGTRVVRSDGHHPASRPSGSQVSGPSGHVGQDGLDERGTGAEVVEAWECSADCPVWLLDEQTGVLHSQDPLTRNSGRKPGWSPSGTYRQMLDKSNPSGGDKGGASRFFYVAKASRAERSAGLDALAEQPLNWSSGDANPVSFQSEGTVKAARNPHPTVKPIALMRWLVRLVTPPDGRVLDPFAGSGTTGIACALEGLDFVGCEQDEPYSRIAEARINFWAEHGEDALKVARRLSPQPAPDSEPQLDLLDGAS